MSSYLDYYPSLELFDLCGQIARDMNDNNLPNCLIDDIIDEATLSTEQVRGMEGVRDRLTKHKWH